MSPMGHNLEDEGAAVSKIPGDGGGGGDDNEGGILEREIKRQIARSFVKLVNAARVKWLADQGWDTRIVRYVDEAITPQNVLMLGERKVGLL